MQKDTLTLLPATLLLVAVLPFVPLTVQAESPTLILETEPEVTEILLQGSVIIDPETGNLLATPTDPQACQGTGESCDDVEVAMQAFSVNNVSAVPGQTPEVDVTQGNNAVFRWNSRGAWECEGFGMTGWTGGNKLPNSPGSGQSVSTGDLALGEYDASIECRNGPVSASRGPVRINVVEANGSPDPDPVQCDDPARQPPPGWTRLTSGNLSCRYDATSGQFVGDCSSWTGIWPFEFPGGNGLPQRLIVNRQSPNEYLAIEFNSSGLGANEIMEIRRNTSTGISSTTSIATISTCPGDFDQESILDETGCYFRLPFLFEDIEIGGSQTTRSCRLESNQTYYLNILHTDAPAGTPANEIESNCGLGSNPNQWCGNIYNPTTPRTQ